MGALTILFLVIAVWAALWMIRAIVATVDTQGMGWN